jgi:hypothetical protein
MDECNGNSRTVRRSSGGGSGGEAGEGSERRVSSRAKRGILSGNGWSRARARSLASLGMTPTSGAPASGAFRRSRIPPRAGMVRQGATLGYGWGVVQSRSHSRGGGSVHAVAPPHRVQRMSLAAGGRILPPPNSFGSYPRPSPGPASPLAQRRQAKGPVQFLPSPDPASTALEGSCASRPAAAL